MTFFALNSSRFSGLNGLGHLPFDRRTWMKKLTPVVAPDDAFHATLAKAAMPATSATAVRNGSLPVCTFCADASTATKVRPLSAAY